MNFISTSTNESTALYFTRTKQTKTSFPVIFTICIDTVKLKSMIANIKYCSYFPSEGEVLLGPGLIYEITESEKDNDVYHIKLKALKF